MKLFLKTAAAAAMLFFCSPVFSQVATDGGSAEPTAADKVGTPGMNIVKLSLTNLVFRNIDLQYERVLTRRVSGALGIKMMPQGGLPLINYFENQLEYGDNGEVDLTQVSVGGYAITPEIRFYLGKGYGRGFYIAPFMRYSSYNVDNFAFHFTDSDQQRQAVVVGGEVKSTSVGLQLGSQFALGRNLVLDWYILGGHVGRFNADLNGTYPPLHPLDRQEAEETIESVEGPEIVDLKVSADVGTTRAVVTAEGRKPGVRLGISLGFRF